MANVEFGDLRDGGDRNDIVERQAMARVRLWWYAAALPVIVVVMFASFGGYAHPIFGVLGLFALFFWLFSLLFVLYGKFKYRKRSP